MMSWEFEKPQSICCMVTCFELPTPASSPSQIRSLRSFGPTYRTGVFQVRSPPYVGTYSNRQRILGRLGREIHIHPHLRKRQNNTKHLTWTSPANFQLLPCKQSSGKMNRDHEQIERWKPSEASSSKSPLEPLPPCYSVEELQRQRMLKNEKHLHYWRPIRFRNQEFMCFEVLNPRREWWVLVEKKAMVQFLEAHGIRCGRSSNDTTFSYFMSGSKQLPWPLTEEVLDTRQPGQVGFSVDILRLRWKNHVNIFWHQS